MSKLFVGGIPVDMDEEELKEIFTQFGKVVNVNIVRDKRTGVSRRYGFVEMDSQEEARSVMDVLNGASIDDHEISVKPIDPNPKKKVTIGKRKISIVPGKPSKVPPIRQRQQRNKRPRLRKEF